jgi:hypothetical protein
MTTPVPRSQTAPDAMPTTRGLDFYATDPNLEFVCSTVLGPAELERARPHLAAMGRVAGGELDALAAEADRHPPVLRTWDARGQRVHEIVRHTAYEAMERISLYARKWLCPPPPRTGVFSPVSLAWLDAIVDWTPVPADALGSAGPSR